MRWALVPRLADKLSVPIIATGGIGDVLKRAAVRSGYSYAPPPQMVTLRAPDGSTKSVPQDQAQHYIQLGAAQVS